VDGIGAVEVLVLVVPLQSSERKEELILKDVAGGDVESSKPPEDVISVSSTTTWVLEERMKTELFSTLISISAKTQKLFVHQTLLQLLSGSLVSSIG
jgi:hypothetical protein